MWKRSDGVGRASYARDREGNMIPATHRSAERPTLYEENGDLFNSQAVWLVIVVLALVAVVTLVGFALIYYGDDVATQPWDERAVPAASTS